MLSAMSSTVYWFTSLQRPFWSEGVPLPQNSDSNRVMLDTKSTPVKAPLNLDSDYVLIDTKSTPVKVPFPKLELRDPLVHPSCMWLLGNVGDRMKEIIISRTPRQPSCHGWNWWWGWMNLWHKWGVEFVQMSRVVTNCSCPILMACGSMLEERGLLQISETWGKVTFIF